jgi:uncharacterized protein (UPF0335 family)
MGLTLADRTDSDGNRITVTVDPHIAAILRHRDKPPTTQAEAFSRDETGEAMSDAIQGDQLKSIVQRIERLEEEKKTISDDIKEVYSEAKANGYDVKVLRKVIAIRKRDLRERREEEAVLDLYLQAVGESA